MKSIKRNRKQHEQQPQQNLEIFNNLNKQIVRRHGEPAAPLANQEYANCAKVLAQFQVQSESKIWKWIDS